MAYACMRIVAMPPWIMNAGEGTKASKIGAIGTASPAKVARAKEIRSFSNSVARSGALPILVCQQGRKPPAALREFIKVDDALDSGERKRLAGFVDRLRIDDVDLTMDNRDVHAQRQCGRVRRAPTMRQEPCEVPRPVAAAAKRN